MPSPYCQYPCPDLDFCSVWSCPPLSFVPFSTPRTLGSVLLFVDMDWNVLVGMRKGQPHGEVRARMGRNLPLAASLPSFPLRRGTGALRHAHSLAPLSKQVHMLWSQPHLTGRQPLQALLLPAPGPDAALGSDSRPTRKYTMLSLGCF